MSLGQRGAARAIDLAVSFAFLVLAVTVVGLLDGTRGDNPEGSGQEATLSDLGNAMVFLLWVGGSFVYEIVSTVKFGGTLGKKAVGTRIVGRTGQRLGVYAIALRSVAAVGLLLLFPITVLDILWPLWDPNRDMLHDKVIGTRVVNSR